MVLIMKLSIDFILVHSLEEIFVTFRFIYLIHFKNIFNDNSTFLKKKRAKNNVHALHSLNLLDIKLHKNNGLTILDEK